MPLNSIAPVAMMPFQIPLRMAWLPATDMPAAGQEMYPPYALRVKVDLSNMSQIRMSLNVMAAGAAGAIVRIQYSLNNVDWSDIVETGNLEVSIASTGFKISSWQNIAAAAKADVYIRMYGQGGDGVLDPALTSMLIQVK